MHIDHVHLRRLDLNLLLAFDALMETHSVSAAADLLGVGQSAMSHALGRLRTLFDDPLLIRSGAGMTPTEKAESLHRPVRAAFCDLETGLEQASDFDPATVVRTFTLSIVDYVAETLGPALLRQSVGPASGIRFRIETLGRADALEALREGRLDAMIGVAETPDWAVAETLFQDSFATVYDPAAWRRPPEDIADFCAAPHALASQAPSFDGWLEPALQRIGRSRRVVFSATRFADAAACVPGGQVLLTLPTTAAHRYAQLYGLAVMPPPLQAPTFEARLFRHRRSSGAPASEWLCATIRGQYARIGGT